MHKIVAIIFFLAGFTFVAGPLEFWFFGTTYFAKLAVCFVIAILFVMIVVGLFSTAFDLWNSDGF